MEETHEATTEQWPQKIVQSATSNPSASGENRFRENASDCTPQVNNDRTE